MWRKTGAKRSSNIHTGNVSKGNYKLTGILTLPLRITNSPPIPPCEDITLHVAYTFVKLKFYNIIINERKKNHISLNIFGYNQVKLCYDSVQKYKKYTRMPERGRGIRGFVRVPVAIATRHRSVEARLDASALYTIIYPNYLSEAADVVQ